MSHNHLSEDDLERMCLGTIDLDELARLTAHLLSCAECAERLGHGQDRNAGSDRRAVQRD